MPLTLAKHRQQDPSRGLAPEDLIAHHLKLLVESINSHLEEHHFFYIKKGKKKYIGFEAWLEVPWITPNLAKRVVKMYRDEGWKCSATVEDTNLHLAIDLPASEREHAKKHPESMKEAEERRGREGQKREQGIAQKKGKK